MTATGVQPAPPAQAAAPDPSAAPGAASRRLRVLVGCYAVSPVRGSEPGMGWNICRTLAAHHDLTVLCTPGVPGWEPGIYRKEIDNYVAAHGPIPGLTIQYVEQPFWSFLWQREKELFRRTMYYSGYASWQRAAFRVARQLHAERPFDLAHQLNMTGFREPGYLWQLGIPFVWGPVGGAANIPAAFLPLMGPSDRTFYRLRNWANERQKRTARRSLRAARVARKIWAIGEENRRMAAELWETDPIPLLESGTKPRPDARVRTRDLTRPLRLVWSGLHIGRKGLPILLHAMQKIGAHVPTELVVLGGGPETSRWKSLASELGIAGKIRWTGQLTQAAALAEVAGADALVFTSVQEGTPHAVLEAISLGLPVICHDACGMGTAVTTGCGVKIPMIDPATSIDGFAHAIETLATEPHLLDTLSAGALARAGELTWDRIGRTIADGYATAVSTGAVPAEGRVMKLDYFHTAAPAPRLVLPKLDTAFLLAVLYVSGTVNAPQVVSVGMSGLGAWTFGMGLVAIYLWLTRLYFPKGLFYVFFPLTLFCLFGLLSILWGGASIHTFQLLATIGGFLGLVLITARECDADLRLIPKLNAAMDVASITAAVGYTLVVFIYGSAGEAYLGGRPLFLARPFALFACIAVARQLARWQGGDGGQRGLAVAVWLTALVMLSQSRTAMLICLSLFPLSFAMKGTAKGIVTGIGMAIVGAAVMSAAIFLYQPLYDRMFKYDASMKVGGVAINASGRTVIWESLWNDIGGSQWLFGHGLGASSRFLDLLFDNIGHPHNDYLRFLYDLGALGLVLFVVFMVVAIGLIWGGVLRCAVRFPAQLSIHLAALLGFVVLTISMATDNPVTYVYLMAPLAIMTGCSICLLQRERKVLEQPE